MAKKKLDKRKFIEGIFNLQVFSNMLTSVRADYNQIIRDLDIECAKYEEISNALGVHVEQKQNQIDDRSRTLDKLHARRRVNVSEVERLKEQANNSVEIDLNKVSSNISKIEKAIPEIESKIQNVITKQTECRTILDINRTKRQKINTDGDTCPVCLSKMDHNHKQHVDDEKKRLDEEIKQLTVKTTTYNDKLEQAKSLLAHLRSKKTTQAQKLSEAHLKKQELRNINEKITQLESLNQDIDDDVKSLDEQDTGFDKIITECEDRLQNTQLDINKIKQKMAKLEIIKFIVSEEGVKSYIVKKILQLFNAKLSHYLKKMDSNCICIFNEYFEEEIINEKGKPCSYFNFSGAERKNIDLACLFAFMDIRRLQGDVAFNFSMYDELFDSSLDERGVELVIDILKERIEQHNECVMVISHRKESTKLATGDIIFLEKQNGTTVRVETPKTELK
jgi:DNA repair exonuclease SbcCD ATPase subunit